MTANFRPGDRVRWPGEPQPTPTGRRRYDTGTLVAPTWPHPPIDDRERRDRARVLVVLWDREPGDIDELDRCTGELLTVGEDERVVLVHRLPRAESRMRAATAQRRWERAVRRLEEA